MDLLPVDDLAVLRHRRSAKWSSYPDDVLPLPVAEMDFALASVIQDCLRAAVNASDTGYAHAEPVLGPPVTAFARGRWNWSVDPDAVTPMPDVGSARSS